MTSRLGVYLGFCLIGALACAKPGDINDAGSGSESDSESGSEGETGKQGPGDLLVDRCDPSAVDACSEFIDPHLCCSDDPAALDLANIDTEVTPAYVGRGGEGTPIFSGGNNALSRSGTCVAEDFVPPAAALADVGAQGCPVPCNPTWSSSDITTVCGSGYVCCQIQELEPEDCVLDPNLGDAGCYRPVTGNDIQGFGGIDATSHATHQDPSGTSCEVFVNAIPPNVLADNGLTASDALLACFRRLSVANRRGYCLAGAAVTACPYAVPTYIDACEQLNADNGLICP